ncbi:penicillin binding protein transpeptidase domain-containing protein [Fulvivirga maritima]|uniref:penicillin-binding transpeptidase domain-containing protein n=1 Tax=Fulvivirga maritima TaxID=2904247 RepID=UPI001F46174E|nr:penicillin-binding transpeptidase domain-containing protein [Fulvivirga maritima]UII29192.1 penicillin binding protein transpeptidase domain-containing protein [Fulvivirga maritima]
MRIIISTHLLLLAFLPLCAQNRYQAFLDECKVQGSITVYNYQTGQWITNDIDDSNKPSVPASTFKIMNSLILLEQGVIKDEKQLVPWIGKENYDMSKYGKRPDTYHDMSLTEAYKFSVPWVYVELGKKMSKKQYKEILNNSAYGNNDLSVEGLDFWNFGDFAVSPADQVKMLIGVYEETLPFSQRSFQIVKNMMLEEETESYSIRAKTGWTNKDGRDIGWWIGYVEKGEEVYFFATRITKNRSEKNDQFINCRKGITRKVLKDLGIL